MRNLGAGWTACGSADLSHELSIMLAIERVRARDNESTFR
eukprot:COSAG06_NODE_3369_length_5441_cov_8.371209_5_plen_40_part_00